MIPAYQSPAVTLYTGHALGVLRCLPTESVQCVVTSPPYWGLRDYGLEPMVWDGEPGCEHEWGEESRRSIQPQRDNSGGLVNNRVESRGGQSWTAGATGELRLGATCLRCGAWRGSLGLEPTPQLYVRHLVAVLREVRRVLRSDGVCFLNLGDSYAGSWGNYHPTGQGGQRPKATERFQREAWGDRSFKPPTADAPGLKPKDLIGIPWRVALALQEPYYTGRIKDERDRIWLASMMDGEGTFTILSTTSPHGSGNSYPPIAQIRMTSEKVIRKAASLVGVASPEQRPPSIGGNRSVYQWRLSARRAADVAAEVYPYLIEKRQQALIVWNHQAVRESYETKRGVTIEKEALAKQLVCRDLIRECNRGRSVTIPSWMQEPPSLMEPGWYLRSDCIWAKPNPMPESVTDRPTRSHEYIFLLTKSATYYWDQEAVRERGTSGPSDQRKMVEQLPRIGGKAKDLEDPYNKASAATHIGRTRAVGSLNRNLRSVWTIATQPYSGAHFATFPEELVKRCVLAGTSERGCCPECGAPWERIREPTGHVNHREPAHAPRSAPTKVDSTGWAPTSRPSGEWRPSCAHPDLAPVPCTVLDPFSGAGTVALVAQKLGRRAIGVDLSPQYTALAVKRLEEVPLPMREPPSIAHTRR